MDNNATQSSPLTLQQNQESSDTESTELTSGTSLRTKASILPLNGSSAELTQNALEGEQSGQPTRKESIRKQYEMATPDISASMEKWFETADRYGFLADDNSGPTQAEKQKEAERSIKWAHMAEPKLSGGESIHSFHWSPKLVSRVYKGIPDGWRGDAWYYLVTDRLQKEEMDVDLRQKYVQFKNEVASPANERQIDLDIPRTMGDHIMFRQRYGVGQRSLFNVLRSFSMYDPEVGYCQGMTNIAAVLLMYYEEQKAFCMLVHMFERDKLRDLYTPGFPTLLESFYIQDRLLEKYLPRLYKHLNDIGISSDVYATRWYITLFTGGVVKYHTLLRILDVYFLTDFDTFYYTAVALLEVYQERLLSNDLDVCMQLLGSAMSVPNDTRFIRTIQKLRDRNQRQNTIERLRKQYRSLSTFHCD